MTGTITREEILVAVRKQIDGLVGFESAKETDRLNVEIGFDELDTVELLMGLEVEFQIDFEDLDSRDELSVGQVVDLVEAALKAKTSIGGSL